VKKISQKNTVHEVKTTVCGKQQLKGSYKAQKRVGFSFPFMKSNEPFVELPIIMSCPKFNFALNSKSITNEKNYYYTNTDFFSE
jgi:hypothetical protein